MQVRSGLAFEAQRLFDVEDDDLAARVLQHEVADRGDRDLGPCASAFVGAEIRIALGDFGRRLRRQQIDEVVDLDAESLSARDLDERLGVLTIGRDRVAEFARRRVRQGDHFVRKMDRILGLAGMAERPQRLAEECLQIHLPRIDDVVNARRPSERQSAGIGLARRRRPQRLAVPLNVAQSGGPYPPHTQSGGSCPLDIELAIVEVASEQTELPELIGEVFADVGHDTVRTDDHLLAALLCVPCVRLLSLRPLLLDLHHPATR